MISVFINRQIVSEKEKSKEDVIKQVGSTKLQEYLLPLVDTHFIERIVILASEDDGKQLVTARSM